MPEGDTVYRTAQLLHHAVAGAVLTGCDIRVPAYATVDLTGETVQEVVSRGKHLFIRVGGYSIHSHLKMEGAWQLYRPGSRWRRPGYQARIVLETAQWLAVGFDLGVVEVVPRSREDGLMAWLGPDLLGADWDDAEAIRRLAADPGRPIASALLDQRNLAGLGNEYVNELCFLRGVLPTRPAGEVDLPGMVLLAHRLIHANRSRAIRSTTGDLRRGRTSWVFGREGQQCRRCGAPIRLARTGSAVSEDRNRFWCPRCQL
ncbi:MAG: DNA-formamidopyrimidine glycosylase family protein [Microbacteriaceae bacterium]